MVQLVVNVNYVDDLAWALEGIRKQIMEGYTSGSYQGVAKWWLEGE